MIAKAKCDWAMHFVNTVEPNKVWSLNLWYKGIRRHTVPPIIQPNRSWAITLDEKALVFTEAFFPPPPTVDTPVFDINEYLGHTRFLNNVTKTKVQDLLCTTSNTSAPGISGLSYQALKWAWDANSDLVHWVIKWSIHMGYHHPSWKAALMVVIPKPNKPNYSAPKVYCPIQLLECLGKLVEKVVAKRIMYNCSRFSLIPPKQFRGVSGTSCINAGLAVTHDMEYVSGKFRLC